MESKIIFKLATFVGLFVFGGVYGQFITVVSDSLVLFKYGSTTLSYTPKSIQDSTYNYTIYPDSTYVIHTSALPVKINSMFDIVFDCIKSCDVVSNSPYIIPGENDTLYYKYINYAPELFTSEYNDTVTTLMCYTNANEEDFCVRSNIVLEYRQPKVTSIALDNSVGSSAIDLSYYTINGIQIYPTAFSTTLLPEGVYLEKQYHVDTKRTDWAKIHIQR